MKLSSLRLMSACGICLSVAITGGISLLQVSRIFPRSGFRVGETAPVLEAAFSGRETRNAHPEASVKEDRDRAFDRFIASYQSEDFRARGGDRPDTMGKVTR